MGLLSFLFGNPNGTNAQGQNPNPGGSMLPGGPPSQAWGMNGGYLTPVPNGGGDIPPPNNSVATPPPHGALVKALAASAPAAPGNQPAPPPQGPQDQPPQGAGGPVTVTGKRPIWANSAPDLGDASRGDTWKPHHESILGNLSDAILGTTIGERDMRQNKMEALQTLESNPELAIARLAKVDPEAAMKLYSEYNSQKHWNAMADASGQRVTDERFQKGGGFVGNMAQNLFTDKNGDPIDDVTGAARYPAFADRARTMLKQFGMSDDQISNLVPDQYSRQTVDELRSMTDPVYRQAMIQKSNSQFEQTLPFRQGNMEANQTRAQAAMAQAGNGAAREQTYQQATNQQGEKIHHDILTHPVPPTPVAAMGDNTGKSAGILVPSNKNPNILYRQHGNYMIEYGKTKGGAGATPTGRAIALDPATGKPTGLVDTRVLATEHPELFSH